MPIETTYNINRLDAIEMLCKKGVFPHDNATNEELGDMLYFLRADNSLYEDFMDFENYCVVDWTEETQPEGQEWSFWRTHW